MRTHKYFLQLNAFFPVISIEEVFGFYCIKLAYSSKRCNVLSSNYYPYHVTSDLNKSFQNTYYFIFNNLNKENHVL